MTDIKFEINKCKTKGGYNAKISKKLDLGKIASDYVVELETPVLLVIGTECGKTIVHDYGEIIFREGKDEEKMRKVAKDIYSKGI